MSVYGIFWTFKWVLFGIGRSSLSLSVIGDFHRLQKGIPRVGVFHRGLIYGFWPSRGFKSDVGK